jgi:hypothetical protein
MTYALPIAVTVAGLAIAGAIMISGRTQTVATPAGYVVNDRWTGQTTLCAIEPNGIGAWVDRTTATLSSAGFSQQEIVEYLSRPIDRESAPMICIVTR